MTEMEKIVWMGSDQVSNKSLSSMAGDLSEMSLDESLCEPMSHTSASNNSIDDTNGQFQSSLMEMESISKSNIDDSNDSSCAEDELQRHISSKVSNILSSPTEISADNQSRLVFKKSIPYNGFSDRPVKEIQKDGIAICEQCGVIGEKREFYARQRRFCSKACDQSNSGLITEPSLNNSSSSTETTVNLQYSKHEFKIELDDFEGLCYDQPFPQIPKPEDIEETTIHGKKSDITESYDWNVQLNKRFFVAAPVSCFKTAPLSDIWENISVGLKVEVENTDCEYLSETLAISFWIATVIKIAGYKALLRYDGFGDNADKDFWVSLCSDKVHHIGWCAITGKSLIPPKTIKNKYGDWKAFLREHLIGARSLPSNYSTKLTESLKSRFKIGSTLEVIDKNRISQVKVAMIHNIIGKRLNVKYYDMTAEDLGFWCHEDSALIHPVGWASRVGHFIVAPSNYIQKVKDGIFEENDATDILFNSIQMGRKEECSDFCVGMKLEAIDPLNLNSICAATIMDVLKYGYIMIKIDSYEADATGADWFCYHQNSPCIFSVGFCAINKIALTPPKGFDQATFSWSYYLNISNNVPIPRSVVNDYVPTHKFVIDMKIEAVDLMDPRLICVATIAQVVGKLLKIHFDGWQDDYDQWVDCDSSDIYPVGWCASVGYKLEGPLTIAKQDLKVPKPLRKKSKKKMLMSNLLKRNVNKVLENKKQQNHVVKPDKNVMDINLEEPEARSQSPVISDQNKSEPVESVLPLKTKKTIKDSAAKLSNSNGSTKVIPRLVGKRDGFCDFANLCPEEWNVLDVVQFLNINNCSTYCDIFNEKLVDGKILLNLSKEDILEYTYGKVGPSLKIFDLIQQLKMKSPSQSRHKKGINIKKTL